MKNTDKELFKQALLEATEEVHQETLAADSEAFTPSAQHLAQVGRILGIDLAPKARRKRYPLKRVIAWGFAAVLLMVSALSAYAYSGVDFGFTERVYGPYTQVGFAYSFDMVLTHDIEETYELGYTPPRYARTRLYAHPQRTECTYTNHAGGRIEFQQYPLGQREVWGFRNELCELAIKRYGETYVYCCDDEDSRTFLWRDHKYAMVLYVDADMNDAEVLKIINGVQVQAQP